MKRIFALVLAALLCLALALPLGALAASDYDLAYDATDVMDGGYMNALGTDTFHRLTEALGVQVRTDIVTSLEDRTIEDYAQAYYNAYDYGYGETKSCINLMIQTHMDGDSLVFDDYFLFLAGGAEYVITPDDQANLESVLDSSLNAEAFAGDLTQDVMACENGLAAYTGYLAELSGDSSIVPPAVPDATAGESVETAAAEEETPMLISAQTEVPAGGYVVDQAGILSEDERAQLDQMAAEASAKYDSGVYIVTVDDYRDFSTESPYEAAKAIYNQGGFGLGADQSGAMLLLSMNDRDYAYIARGEFGNYAFTDYGKAQLEEEFLDNFRNDDWYGGFQDFITESDYYMSQADAGTPIDVPVKEPVPTGTAVAGSVGVGAAVSCAGSAIRCSGLKKKMKSVKTKADATQYMAAGAAGLAGGLILRASTDQFINTTVTRVPIHVDNDNHKGGWSGGTTIDSGGFSGHSGKF